MSDQSALSPQEVCFLESDVPGSGIGVLSTAPLVPVNYIGDRLEQIVLEKPAIRVSAVMVPLAAAP